LSHKSMIQWQAIRFPPPADKPEEGDKWGFVVAVPAGRTPTFLDTPMTAAFKDRLPKTLVPGGTPMFVFNSPDGNVPPPQVASIPAEQIRKHEVAGPPPRSAQVAAKPDRLTLIGENIISHDAYIYDDRGGYKWTEEAFAAAKAQAMNA